MNNLTPEMIEKAKAARSAGELLEIAKENGIEMRADEAATCFAQLNPKSGALDDDDLDNVAGGACNGSDEGSSVLDICPTCNGALNNGIGSGDTMRLTCTACGAEFTAYAREGFSVLHPLN